MGQRDISASGAFLRLAILLVWYASVGLLSLLSLCYIMPIIMAINLAVVGSLGGSKLAKGTGFAASFLAMLGIIGVIALPVGYGWGVVSQRWPNNWIERIIRWMKA